MSNDYKDILFAIKDYVCTITINRPKSLNAFTGDTIAELEDAVLRTYDDNSIGVVVLTGAGDRAFSAGGDVKWEADGGLDAIEWHLGRYVVDCPKPVIARVPGYAIGGGNHLAYVCDFTIAAEHARFGQTGPRVGSPASGYPDLFFFGGPQGGAPGPPGAPSCPQRGGCAPPRTPLHSVWVVWQTRPTALGPPVLDSARNDVLENTTLTSNGLQFSKIWL